MDGTTSVVPSVVETVPRKKVGHVWFTEDVGQDPGARLLSSECPPSVPFPTGTPVPLWTSPPPELSRSVGLPSTAVSCPTPPVTQQPLAPPRPPHVPLYTQSKTHETHRSPGASSLHRPGLRTDRFEERAWHTLHLTSVVTPR